MSAHLAMQRTKMYVNVMYGMRASDIIVNCEPVQKINCGVVLYLFLLEVSSTTKIVKSPFQVNWNILDILVLGCPTVYILKIV